MLLRFVTGASKRPSENIPIQNTKGLTEEIINPDYEAWARSD